MNRKEFLRLSAGIVSALGIPCALGKTANAAEVQPGQESGLDESYLVKGLTGMVRARGWFDAHWGAGVLAGYYLCRDNPLGAETRAGIKEQLDTVIQLRPAQFAALEPEEADEDQIEEVLTALEPAMEGGLRAHGHAVIFASLSTRALRDASRMALPAVIQALCGLSRQISRIAPQKPSDPAEPYADTPGMIEATFDSLVRFEGLLGHPSVRRPNFTHMITHTEALLNLELMGYPDVARKGQIGHQVHISAPVPIVPETDASVERPSLQAVMSHDYWKEQRNQERWSQKWHQTENPNGDWIASGHLFKVLYSYHRLIQRIEDKEKVRLCSEILLERYVNPEVQGG